MFRAAKLFTFSTIFILSLFMGTVAFAANTQADCEAKWNTNMDSTQKSYFDNDISKFTNACTTSTKTIDQVIEEAKPTTITTAPTRSQCTNTSTYKTYAEQSTCCDSVSGNYEKEACHIDALKLDIEEVYQTCLASATTTTEKDACTATKATEEKVNNDTRQIIAQQAQVEESAKKETIVNTAVNNASTILNAYLKNCKGADGTTPVADASSNAAQLSSCTIDPNSPIPKDMLLKLKQEALGTSSTDQRQALATFFANSTNTDALKGTLDAATVQTLQDTAESMVYLQQVSKEQLNIFKTTNASIDFAEIVKEVESQKLNVGILPGFSLEGGRNIYDFFDRIIGFLAYIAGTLGVLLWVFESFLVIQGNDSSIQRYRKKILNIAIGLVVFFGAYLIVSTIVGIVYSF